MNFKKWWRRIKIKIGIQLLKGFPLITEEANYFMSDCLTITIPSDINYLNKLRYEIEIYKTILSLMESNCLPQKISKIVDITNGNIVITITYISKNTYENLLYWVSKKFNTDDAEIKIEDLMVPEEKIKPKNSENIYVN